MSTAQSVFNFFSSIFTFLLAHVELNALVVGMLAAISITQVIKMLVIRYAPSNGGRALWYSVTFVIGLTVTWINWPTANGFSWGLTVGGLFAPALYIVGTRILYRYFPDAEKMISATPKNPQS